MSLQGHQLATFCASRRATAKARAPFYTAAKNALKRGVAKLVKTHGGDSLLVAHLAADGVKPLGLNGALDDLQRGKAVILRMVHETRAPAGIETDWTDLGEYETKGELTIKLTAAEARKS